MSCSSPVALVHPYTLERFSAPCNHCASCLASKINQISFLATRQFLYYWRVKNQNSSFVTLTYNDNYLPLNEFHTSTLRRRDLTLFLKRFRINLKRYNLKHSLPHRRIPEDFKVIYNGEYGSEFGRPHYHIIFLGLNESQVKTLIGRSWYNMCRIDIGPLGPGGIRYVCKYIDKSDTPDKCVQALRDSLSVESPFFYHSIKMALPWIIANKDRIIQNKFQFFLNGKSCFYPKYIIRFLSNISCIDYKPIILNELISKYGPKSESSKFRSLLKISQDYQDDLKIKEYLNFNSLVSRGLPISSASMQARYKPISKTIRVAYINSLIKQIA